MRGLVDYGHQEIKEREGGREEEAKVEVKPMSGPEVRRLTAVEVLRTRLAELMARVSEAEEAAEAARQVTFWMLPSVPSELGWVSSLATTHEFYPVVSDGSLYLP